MKSHRGHLGHARGWLIAIGCGVLAGYLVGVGMTGTYTHAKWPALAGLIMGMACSLAAPSRQVFVAFCVASVAVAVAVAMVALAQVYRGHWPITGEATIAQYGTATEATIRAAVLLGALIGIPCLATTALVSVAKQRNARGSAPTSGCTTDAIPRAGEVQR